MQKVAFLVIAVLFCLSMFTSGADAALGDNCTDNANCSAVTNAECKNNVCACASGFGALNESCVTAVALGKNCTGDVVCSTSNSECDSKSVCACKKDYANDHGKCVKTAALGKSCDHGEVCITKYSECGSGKVCACKKDYNKDHGKCVKNETTSSADSVKAHPLLAASFLLLTCYVFLPQTGLEGNL